MKTNPNARLNECLFLLGLCLTGWHAQNALAANDTPAIAGLAPYERPAAAPRLTSAPPVDRQHALWGVTAPVPQSIEKFLKDQGGWFNPFLRPGMTGPYDLRGWHATPVEAKKP